MPKKQPIRIADLYRFRPVSDPQIAPNGEHIVYVQEWREQGKRKGEKERDLKKLRDKKEKGEKKSGGKPGETPADRAYHAEGKGPDGAAPRAEGSGRWGDLPLKEFKEALASGKWVLPEKYKAMILKYMEMLAKKATEEKK